jgi:hypothetical protein
VISIIGFLKCVVFVDQSVDSEVHLQPIQLLLQACGDEESIRQPVVQLPSASGSGTDMEDDLKAGPILFMLPGLEGMAIVLEPLARNLKYQTVCLQLGYSHLGQTVQDMAQSLLQVQITPQLSNSFTGFIKISRVCRLLELNECVDINIVTDKSCI